MFSFDNNVIVDDWDNLMDLSVRIVGSRLTPFNLDLSYTKMEHSIT
jgi:hypothetical protein